MTNESAPLLFEISGVVVAGQKKAAPLGYPTANIPCSERADIPSGIFAGEAILNGTAYPAALYKEDGRDVVEAHLLDLSRDLYGETLTLRGRHKVRDPRKFTDRTALAAAIADDIATIRKLCSPE